MLCLTSYKKMQSKITAASLLPAAVLLSAHRDSASYLPCYVPTGFPVLPMSMTKWSTASVTHVPHMSTSVFKCCTQEEEKINHDRQIFKHISFSLNPFYHFLLEHRFSWQFWLLFQENLSAQKKDLSASNDSLSEAANTKVSLVIRMLSRVSFLKDPHQSFTNQIHEYWSSFHKHMRLFAKIFFDIWPWEQTMKQCSSKSQSFVESCLLFLKVGLMTGVEMCRNLFCN